MEITRTDPFTGKENTIDLPITEEQMTDWMMGTHIQTSMPNLTADQREFLISGIFPGEFDKHFPPNLEEEEMSEEEINYYELATACFEVENVSYKFEVVSNLKKFNLNIIDALHNWLARTKTYEIEDFCEYVMSKNESIICVTKEYYDSLPDDINQ